MNTEHKDPSASETAKQIPFIEMLRSVPLDGHQRVEDGAGHRNIPYGVMIHEAADRLQQCRTKLAEVERERDEIREFHNASIKSLYEQLGVDGSDGEYRFKWASLAVGDLKTRLQHSEAVRAELAALLERAKQWVPLNAVDAERVLTHPVVECRTITAIDAALARHRAAPSGQDAKEEGR